jgi:hypothetical protein
MEGPQIAPQILALDLPGEKKNGRRTGISGAEGGEGILDSRARDNQAHPGLTLDPGIPVSHVNGALFMADGNQAEVLLAVKGIKDGHNLDSGNGKKVLHSFSFQRFDDCFSSGHSGHIIPPILCSSVRSKSISFLQMSVSVSVSVSVSKSIAYRGPSAIVFNVCSMGFVL